MRPCTIGFDTRSSRSYWYHTAKQSGGHKYISVGKIGKSSVQPHTTLCIQFLDGGNNDKNNTLPLGKQICFTIVWGCAEMLPKNSPDGITIHKTV